MELAEGETFRFGISAVKCFESIAPILQRHLSMYKNIVSEVSLQVVPLENKSSSTAKDTVHKLSLIHRSVFVDNLLAVTVFEGILQ